MNNCQKHECPVSYCPKCREIMEDIVKHFEQYCFDVAGRVKKHKKEDHEQTR